jgi:hypothetical protein
MVLLLALLSHAMLLLLLLLFMLGVPLCVVAACHSCLEGGGKGP